MSTGLELSPPAFLVKPLEHPTLVQLFGAKKGLSAAQIQRGNAISCDCLKRASNELGQFTLAVPPQPLYRNAGSRIVPLCSAGNNRNTASCRFPHYCRFCFLRPEVSVIDIQRAYVDRHGARFGR